MYNLNTIKAKQKPTSVAKEKSIQYYLNAIRNSDKKIQKEYQRTGDFRRLIRNKQREDIADSVKKSPYRRYTNNYSETYLYVRDIQQVEIFSTVEVNVSNIKISRDTINEQQVLKQTVVITKEEFEKHFNNVSNKLKTLCGI